MPEYLYENPKTGAIVSVIQRMLEPHVYQENGVAFKRIFIVPQASIDAKIDPNNPKDFVSKTRNKSESLGSLFDRSAELSARRAGNSGIDPIKQKFYDDYAAKRKGKRHPQEAKEKFGDTILI